MQSKGRARPPLNPTTRRAFGSLQFDICGNGVGDAGASSLASALEKNTTLQTLWLGGNKMGDAGLDALLKHGERVNLYYE